MLFFDLNRQYFLNDYLIKHNKLTNRLNFSSNAKINSYIKNESYNWNKLEHYSQFVKKNNRAFHSIYKALNMNANKNYPEGHLTYFKEQKKQMQDIKYFNTIQESNNEMQHVINMTKKDFEIFIKLNNAALIFCKLYQDSNTFKMLHAAQSSDITLSFDNSVFCNFDIDYVCIHNDGFSVFFQDHIENQNVTLNNITNDDMLRGIIEKIPITFDVTNQAIGYKRGLLSLLLSKIPGVRLLALSYEEYSKDFYFYFVMDIFWDKQIHKMILQVGDSELYLSSGYATYTKIDESIEKLIEQNDLIIYNAVSIINIENGAIYIVFAKKNGYLRRYVVQQSNGQNRILYELPGNVNY